MWYLQVSGLLPPRPVTSFAHFGFDENLMEAIRKSEYSSPTPIQAQVGRWQKHGESFQDYSWIQDLEADFP